MPEDDVDWKEYKKDALEVSYCLSKREKERSSALKSSSKDGRAKMSYSKCLRMLVNACMMIGSFVAKKGSQLLSRGRVYMLEDIPVGISE